MTRLSLFSLTAVVALTGGGVAYAQSGDPDRIDRQLALGHAAAIENAFGSVAERIRVTDVGNLWDDEWDGVSDPAVSDWWLHSWTRRGLTARYCDGVLAVYASKDELKGVGVDQTAVQVAPVVYGNARSGLQLITQGSRVYSGAHGREGGSLPGCMPIPSTTGERVALVSTVADPKVTPVGLRWENQDRTVECTAPDTGTMVERRRVPIQVTAVENCPPATPNCNDLRELAATPPAWPVDCAGRETLLAATPPGLPANAACTDWARWRSNCQIVYAAASPPADIPDAVITWEPGAVHSWTSSCSCPSGQTGSCTEHWAQNTEWRVFALTPDTPDGDKVRTRVPARGTAGRRRLVNTVENCTPIAVNEGDPGDGGPGSGDGDPGGPDGGGPDAEAPSAEDDSATEGFGSGPGAVGPPGSDGVSTGNPSTGNDGDGNGGGGGKPIVLDLDGDGVELVPLEKSTALYDINGNGSRERMAWVAPDDGFLAYDADGDGAIAGKDELSFLTYVETAETDLEGLRYFDTDGDGKLDPDDAEWGMFRVWRDLDQDGESDPGELRSLDEAGIRSVSLTSDSVKREVAGSTVYGEGVYVGPNGPRAFWDVVLRTAPRVE